MAWISSLSYPRLTFLWVGLLAFALVALPDHSRLSFPVARAAPVPPSDRTKGEEKLKAQNAKDLKELQKVFGNNPVTILYSPHNYAAPWSVEGAQITDVVEALGKQYLRVQKKDGKPMLIRADLITAIRDD
jgi:hypothetical protein